MSENVKTRVTVNIYGSQYKLMGNAETPVTYLQLIAAEVDEQMQKIAKGFPHLDMPRIAVLTAVNYADEMAKLKEDNIHNDHKDHKLKSEYEQLKREYELQREQISNYKIQQENKQRELEVTQQEFNTKLETKQNEFKAQLETKQKELLMLQTEYSELHKQYDVELNRKSQIVENDKNIHEDYNQLKEEYRKLQSEYNEWIQLVDQNEPGS